jgi:hypothetical protein
VGQQGYVQQNMYNILNKDEDDDSNNNAIVVIQTAAAAAVAATTGSTIGSTYTATTTMTILTKVTAAINQLLANQVVIMQQMAATSFCPQPSIAVPAFNVPPIQNVTIPT